MEPGSALAGGKASLCGQASCASYGVGGPVGIPHLTWAGARGGGGGGSTPRHGEL